MPVLLGIPFLLEISFGVLLIATVTLGMHNSSQSWLDPLIAAVRTRRGGLFRHIIELPGRLLIGAALSAYVAVSHSLSATASHAMRPLADFFRGLGTLALYWSLGLGLLAHDVAGAFEGLTTRTIPRAIRGVESRLGGRIKHALRLAAAAAAAAYALGHWIRHLMHTTVLPSLHFLRHAVTVTLPHSIAGLRTRVRDVETQLSRPTRRWLRRIAAAMWGAYLAGAVVKLLAKRFPWLFCRQVRTVGKTVCGVNSDLFESLLADVAAVAAVLSVVTFANELRAFFHADLPGLNESPLEIIVGGVAELANLPPGEYL